MTKSAFKYYLVFVGKVQKVEQFNQPNPEGVTWPGFRVDIAVTQTLYQANSDSAKSPSKLTIVTNEPSAACGYEFTVGETYLVYADMRDAQLRVNNCSPAIGATELRDFEAFVGKLGKSIEKLKKKQKPK